MLARKRTMLTLLHELLRGEGVGKHYQALLAGRWKGRQHRIDAPLQKVEQGGERMMRVGREGKASVTEFCVLEQFRQATLVEAQPLTGRTHQIRVHAQFAGHPVAGDEKYAEREQLVYFQQMGLRRLFLHAARLRVAEISLDIQAPLPEELAQVLSHLRSRDAGESV
jgi:23S rRNA pseudouridine955/2504/2580 synthase